MIHIKNPETGEEQIVNSLAGYETWDVIKENVARPRGDCIRKDDKWVVDRESHRKAKLQSMTKPEIMDFVTSELAKLQNQINEIKESLRKE